MQLRTQVQCSFTTGVLKTIKNINVYILFNNRYYQFANIGEFLKHAGIKGVLLVKVEICYGLQIDRISRLFKLMVNC